MNQLSFFITQGQKVAFVGESGCGKSTTIQMLERGPEVIGSGDFTLASTCGNKPINWVKTASFCFPFKG